MSMIAFHRINCDGAVWEGGALHACRQYQIAETAVEVQAGAIDNGWERVSTHHYCLRCAASQRRARGEGELEPKHEKEEGSRCDSCKVALSHVVCGDCAGEGDANED